MVTKRNAPKAHSAAKAIRIAELNGTLQKSRSSRSGSAQIITAFRRLLALPHPS